MDYKETLEYLYSQVPMFQNSGAGAYKPGLDTTLTLAKAWGNPHQGLRCIHVGGTNGKGSTTHTIAAVLQSAGYKVGLYTSPHLVDFRERIRVNGEPISREFVMDFIERFRADSSLTALQPTFFELTTIMAFAWFRLQNVDYAVIEVGLGGRLDCTNIISPMICAITNISLDHTALLGNTEEAIAREKAGIIKPGVPVVIGSVQGVVRKVFEDKAKEVGAPIIFAEDTHIFKTALQHNNNIEYSGTPYGDISGELTGDCQPENTATVLNVLQAAKIPGINDAAVKNGFANVCSLTGLMGRWMHIKGLPCEVICDTGHNIGGWRHLGPSLKRIAAHKDLKMVIGFVNDKDVNAIMEQMPADADYYFATPSVARGRDSESTMEIAEEHALYGEAFHDVASAFEAALDDIDEEYTDAAIFVGGSTFIVADLLTYLNKES